MSACLQRPLNNRSTRGLRPVFLKQFFYLRFRDHTINPVATLHDDISIFNIDAEDINGGKQLIAQGSAQHVTIGMSSRLLRRENAILQLFSHEGMVLGKLCEAPLA